MRWRKSERREEGREGVREGGRERGEGGRGGEGGGKRDTDTHTQSIIILCISNRIFMSLSELEYFNISSNKLDSIKAPPHSCPRLVCLIIHSNKLKEFPVFPLMPSVETLDLSCNELQTMPQVREMLIFYMYWIIRRILF